MKQGWVGRGMRRGTRLGLVLLCLAGNSLAADPAPVPAGKPFALRVLDAGSKLPLANVQVKYSGENNKLLRGVTDAEGKFTFNLPAANNRQVYIQISEPAHVPITLRWNPANEPGRDSYDALLPVAVPISGRVQDEAGEPVGGAKVAFSLSNDRDSEWPHVYIAVGQETVTTDVNGVWTFNQTPEDISTLTMGVFHPQYVVNDRNEAYYSYERVTNGASLRDGSHVVTLKKGVAITGSVVDENGKPVPTASVAIGSDRFPSNIVPPVKVDNDGKFMLAAVPGAPLTITATAKGKSPDLQVIQVTSTPPEVTMKLLAPQTLTGKVVDAEGKPVRGANVSIDTWRGARTIQKRMTTNAEGKFNWPEAPADEVLVDVYDGRHASNRNIKMSPGKENVVTLSSPLTVTATVVDDATSQPVPAFTVVQGIQFDNGDRISWQRHQIDSAEARGANGQFVREFNEGYRGIALSVQAPGYLPAESPAWPSNAGAIKYEFRLKKGKDITGVVTTAYGQPLAKAQVLLGLPGNGIQTINGKVPPYMGRGQIRSTDEQGRFRFDPQAGKFMIIVLADEGYAEVKSNQFAGDAPTIKLQRWGRVEGQAFIGSKPAADVFIDGNASIMSDGGEDGPSIYPRYETKADETGHFLFDRVAPGSELRVGRRIQLSANSYTSTSSPPVSVKAGETTTVRIGGTGRPVVGRVKLDDSLAGQPWGDYHAGLSTSQRNTGIMPPQPAGFDKMTPDERRAYWETWRKTDEGKAYLAQLAGAQRTMRHYGFALESDGTFRIEDVDPGTYSINIQLQKPSNDRRGYNNDILAMASAEIVVPPIANGTQSDEATTVADIIAKPVKQFEEQQQRRQRTTAPTSQPN